MIKRLATLLLFLHFSVAYSQTIKTDVLVIGGTPSGVAAAVQSARSKVKTILVEEAPQLCPELFKNDNLIIQAGKGAQSGIWMELIKRVIAYNNKLPDAEPQLLTQFRGSVAANILTEIADTIKNLTIDTNTKFISIKKYGDHWEVVVGINGKIQTIKPRIVIDATENTNLLKEVNAEAQKQFIGISYNNELYRTSIGLSDFEINAEEGPVINPFQVLPMRALVAKGITNFLETNTFDYASGYELNLPGQLSIGQGAGVIAAYCAFFKTTTADLKPRIIQGELLDFKGYLLPFTDLSDDPYWRAIQQVCATGMLKGKHTTVDGNEQFLFQPDSIVTTAEVKPVLLETYTRAFLWFNAARPGKEFTVGNLLSFISEITLTDPDNMQKSMAKDWKSKFKFISDFDPERPITRREFAILANQYLNPFGRAVDLDGRIVN